MFAQRFAIALIASLFVLGDAANLGLRSEKSCFRAAILDQVPQMDPAGSQQKTIDLNLELYEQAAGVAKKNGADILVYPEEGVHFEVCNDRQEAIKYGETIPNQRNVAMCEQKYASTNPMMHRLACIAKTNQMFIAANLLDVQPCDHTHDNDKNISQPCPADNVYVFNTAVLLDRTGTMLAKYHKIHLFGEEAKNLALTTELVVLDTELGRLGLQICFDLMFDTPGHEMARRGMIDTLLFPTRWVDQAPFLGASQIQMSWSMVHGVNVLAANIHNPESGAKGSGIYAGSRKQFEVINNIDTNMRMLLATLPVNRSNTDLKQCELSPKTVEIDFKSKSATKPVTKSTNTPYYFHLTLSRVNTSMKQLLPTDREVSVCHEGVCCHVEYRFDNLDDADNFYLVAANRTKPGPFPFMEEFCGMMHCPKTITDSTDGPCREIQSDAPLNSKFFYVKLSGEFSANATIFPSVIGSEHRVMKLRDDDGIWSYESAPKSGYYMENVEQIPKQKMIVTAGKNETNKSYPIATVGLYGRPFDRDPPFKQRHLGTFSN